MAPNTHLCTKLTIHIQANTPSEGCKRFLSFSDKDKKVFLITWDDIYRSSILVRIYILIVQGRKALVVSLCPLDKEGCLCLKSLQFLVLPDCSLILDRSYSSHWQDMRPKPRQILTSSSVKFRWSDWKGCPCSQAHVSEAIYYKTKPFASSNESLFLCGRSIVYFSSTLGGYRLRYRLQRMFPAMLWKCPNPKNCVQVFQYQKLFWSVLISLSWIPPHSFVESILNDLDTKHM